MVNINIIDNYRSILLLLFNTSTVKFYTLSYFSCRFKENFIELFFFKVSEIDFLVKISKEKQICEI